jgi:hypothetical protein
MVVQAFAVALWFALSPPEKEPERGVSPDIAAIVCAAIPRGVIATTDPKLPELYPGWVSVNIYGALGDPMPNLVAIRTLAEITRTETGVRVVGWHARTPWANDAIATALGFVIQHDYIPFAIADQTEDGKLYYFTNSWPLVHYYRQAIKSNKNVHIR